MRRGTTPNITVSVDADLSELDIHLAFDAGTLIVKSGDDLDVEYADGVTTVSAKLTQADTLSMTTGHCMVQLRAFNADGSIAMATDIGTVRVDGILEEGELPNAGISEG